jgi:hypothetical protein
MLRVRIHSVAGLPRLAFGARRVSRVDRISVVNKTSVLRQIRGNLLLLRHSALADRLNATQCPRSDIRLRCNDRRPRNVISRRHRAVSGQRRRAVASGRHLLVRRHRALAEVVRVASVAEVVRVASVAEVERVASVGEVERVASVEAAEPAALVGAGGGRAVRAVAGPTAGADGKELPR